MSKLDRFLVSDSLLCNCPRISSVTLDRYLSDHRPILMRESIYDYGPIPFKFYHYWFEIDGFDKLVEDSWNEIHVVDNNAYVRFMKKLKLLKERIKAWNSSYRELKNCRKNTLKTELTNLDSVLDRGEGIDTDVTRRSDVVRILQDIEKTKAMERNNLAIRGVLVDGNWVESPQLVKNEFYTHFKQRFEKPNLSGIQFDREFPNKICSEQAVDLEREVSKEEVKRAVWDCGTDKAPGPDGFTFGFYRRFWNLIECDVVNAVKWFFLHERIPSGGNSSFITLIPKVSNANMVKDFRPISLIGSVYKIVAKILANHLNQSTIGYNCRVPKVERAIRQIGCMALKMPFKYLGSVVGDRMSRVKAWNDVIDTLVTRLSRWKLKTISIGGRLTLLKSVLGSTPIFHMSIYKVPMAVLRTMEGIRARFFNGADNKVRKSSWVSWNQVMASKDAGGLGVASLFALNRGLMFKWVWRFITQKNSLWAKVITAIHGDDGKIGKTVKPTFPSIWLNIIQEVAVMKLKGIDVRCILSDTKDTWTWSLEGSGEFSVSSIRKTIDAAFLPCGNVKTRWVNEVPIKINILA
ncbi:hypothetical protein Tco_0282636 [Tanacetum coccineum]